MKYEHKIVGLSYTDAETSKRMDNFNKSQPVMAEQLYPRWQHGTESNNLSSGMEWHVVGTILGPVPSASSSYSQTYFLMERELHD